MIEREQRLRDRHAGEAVRTILVILAPLVEDDVALILEFLLGQRRQQVPHPIGFHPQGEFERTGGNDFPIVGPIGVGRSVQQASGLLQRLEEALVIMLGPFEHQVFKKMREPCAPRPLVLGTHVIPDIDGDHRQLPMLVDDDVKAVVECPLDIRYVHRMGVGRSESRISLILS